MFPFVPRGIPLLAPVPLAAPAPLNTCLRPLPCIPVPRRTNHVVPQDPHAEAMLVCDGVLVAVGTTRHVLDTLAGALGLAGEGAEVLQPPQAAPGAAGDGSGGGGGGSGGGGAAGHPGVVWHDLGGRTVVPVRIVGDSGDRGSTGGGREERGPRLEGGSVRDTGCTGCTQRASLLRKYVGGAWALRVGAVRPGQTVTLLVAHEVPSCCSVALPTDLDGTSQRGWLIQPSVQRAARFAFLLHPAFLVYWL